MKGNGTVLCLLTTAGLWQGMHLPWNAERQTKLKKTKKKKKLFVLNNEFKLKRAVLIFNLLCKYYP